MDYFQFVSQTYTAQKLKFSIKDFFSKYDQIRSLLRIWSYLLKKSLMEDFICCAVLVACSEGPRKTDFVQVLSIKTFTVKTSFGNHLQFFPYLL